MTDLSDTSRVRVLAVGAHPDDPEIACGGTLARHRDEGHKIMLLALSSGEAGGEVVVRTQEAVAAAEMLGAELRIHDFPDTELVANRRLIGALEAAIEDFRPTHLYTHGNADTHQDHRIIHSASLVAGRKVANVLCYQSPSSTVSFAPNLYTDIGSTLQAKLELVACFESQRFRTNLANDMIVGTARYWGRFAACAHAEAFEIVRMRYLS